MRPTHGTILIIAAGVCSILVSLGLAFLVRMRGDVNENRTVQQTTQARLMLMAACNYILEAGRIGWDPRANLNPLGDHDGDGILNQDDHHETFGWVDVRDGSVGPKIRLTDPPVVPIGWTARFVFDQWEQAPYAVRPLPAPNAIVTDDASPLFGLPLLTKPDPLPLASSAAVFLTGDDRRRPESENLSWFRIHRDGPATFVITAGAGASRGYQDWDDVPVAERSRLFFNDPGIFADIVHNEIRQWYRIEWSAAISPQDTPRRRQNHHTGADRPDVPVWRGYNTTQGLDQPTAYLVRDTWLEAMIPASRNNACGTIQWVQRLREPPERW